MILESVITISLKCKVYNHIWKTCRWLILVLRHIFVIIINLKLSIILEGSTMIWERCLVNFLHFIIHIYMYNSLFLNYRYLLSLPTLSVKIQAKQKVSRDSQGYSFIFLIPRINPSFTALNSARRTNDHGHPLRASYRSIGVSAKDKGKRVTGEENWSTT